MEIFSAEGNINLSPHKLKMLWAMVVERRDYNLEPLKAFVKVLEKLEPYCGKSFDNLKLIDYSDSKSAFIYASNCLDEIFIQSAGVTTYSIEIPAILIASVLNIYFGGDVYA